LYCIQAVNFSLKVLRKINMSKLSRL